MFLFSPKVTFLELDGVLSRCKGRTAKGVRQQWWRRLARRPRCPRETLHQDTPALGLVSLATRQPRVASRGGKQGTEWCRNLPADKKKLGISELQGPPFTLSFTVSHTPGMDSGFDGQHTLPNASRITDLDVLIIRENYLSCFLFERFLPAGPLCMMKHPHF